MTAAAAAAADEDAADPPCGHPGCRRDADYRIQVPGSAPAVRCRWHADSLWRPHGAAARISALHAEVPPIDAHAVRATLVPALLLAAFAVIVVVGFAALAPVML